MVGPYMKSGESIILTTDRVLIDDTEYDLILTSQRLALVDSGHTTDQPQVVPFATILSVKGETTPAREPLITLTVIDPAGLDDAKTLTLIFSQQPYQDRSAECDLWVKKLIEHIVSVRQEPGPAGKQPPAEKPRGMQPTLRRFIAPDLPRPHSEVPQSHRPSEELLSAMQGAAWQSLGDRTEEPVPGENTVTEHEPEEIVSPVASVSAGDECAGTQDTWETGPAAAVDHGEETLIEPAPDKESTPPGERSEHTIVPATPFRELVPEITGGVQDYPAPAQPDNRQTGPVADIEELSRQIEGVVPVQTEETVTFRPEAGEPTGIPDSVVFPVLSGTAPDAVPASVPSSTPPAGARPAAGQPPVPQPKKKRTGMVVAIALVLLVIIGVTAIILLPSLSENAGGPGSPAITPNVTPQPVTTAVPTVTIPPPLGVWVKVADNGTYYGKYGNPGSLIEARGTGVQFYAIKNSNGLVQVTFQKLDYSGDTLTVEVYNNGTMVTHISKSTPGGTIALLVDPVTGKAPYVPVTTASV